MTDISREAVDDLARELIIACDKADHLHTEIEATVEDGRLMAATILALRAALDAAEADKSQAMLDERERCAAKVERDQWPTFGDSRRIAAAIRNQGEPK